MIDRSKYTSRAPCKNIHASAIGNNESTNNANDVLQVSTVTNNNDHIEQNVSNDAIDETVIMDEEKEIILETPNGNVNSVNNDMTLQLTSTSIIGSSDNGNQNTRNSFAKNNNSNNEIFPPTLSEIKSKQSIRLRSNSVTLTLDSNPSVNMNDNNNNHYDNDEERNTSASADHAKRIERRKKLFELSRRVFKSSGNRADTKPFSASSDSSSSFMDHLEQREENDKNHEALKMAYKVKEKEFQNMQNQLDLTLKMKSQLEIEQDDMKNENDKLKNMIETQNNEIGNLQLQLNNEKNKMEILLDKQKDDKKIMEQNLRMMNNTKDENIKLKQQIQETKEKFKQFQINLTAADEKLVKKLSLENLEHMNHVRELEYKLRKMNMKYENLLQSYVNKGALDKTIKEDNIKLSKRNQDHKHTLAIGSATITHQKKQIDELKKQLQEANKLNAMLKKDMEKLESENMDLPQQQRNQNNDKLIKQLESVKKLKEETEQNLTLSKKKFRQLNIKFEEHESSLNSEIRNLKEKHLDQVKNLERTIESKKQKILNLSDVLIKKEKIIDTLFSKASRNNIDITTEDDHNKSLNEIIIINTDNEDLQDSLGQNLIINTNTTETNQVEHEPIASLQSGKIGLNNRWMMETDDKKENHNDAEQIYLSDKWKNHKQQRKTNDDNVHGDYNQDIILNVNENDGLPSNIDEWNFAIADRVINKKNVALVLFIENSNETSESDIDNLISGTMNHNFENNELIIKSRETNDSRRFFTIKSTNGKALEIRKHLIEAHFNDDINVEVTKIQWNGRNDRNERKSPLLLELIRFANAKNFFKSATNDNNGQGQAKQSHQQSQRRKQQQSQQRKQQEIQEQPPRQPHPTGFNPNYNSSYNQNYDHNYIPNFDPNYIPNYHGNNRARNARYGRNQGRRGKSRGYRGNGRGGYYQQQPYYQPYPQQQQQQYYQQPPSHQHPNQPRRY